MQNSTIFVKIIKTNRNCELKNVSGTAAIMIDLLLHTSHSQGVTNYKKYICNETNFNHYYPVLFIANNNSAK